MAQVTHIDHIAIVVDKIDSAMEFWRDSLGLELSHVQEVPEQASTVAFFSVGKSDLELVQPTTDGSGVARFLQKHGPGMHHICFAVDDLAATLLRLKSRGVRLINDTPQLLASGKKIAFIHPESAHGVLVELYEQAG
jgi:methylmalonyl-CoA/ethylmalonyl-CoA epimerase